MKKIVVCLFILQLLIISLYGLLAFKGITINDYLYANKTSIMVRFWYPHEYEFFINLIEENELTVYRYVTPDSESINIYTSDITLDNQIQLLSGTLPTPNTTEFISNKDTKEPNQSGIFRNLFPNTNIIISHINATENFAIDGIYYISTTDIRLIDNIVYELINNIDYVEVLSIGNEGGASYIAIDTSLQLYEFIMITILILLCILTCLAQYSISQLKPSVILLLHGYSKVKFLKITTLKIIKLLVISAFIAYLLFVIYLIYSGYYIFLIRLSFYFLILCVSMVTIYTLLVNILIFLYLLRLNILAILKGKKPYYLIQVLNHSIKLVFIIFLLINIYFFIDSYTLLNSRLEALSNWEEAENYYRTIVYGDEIGNFALDAEVNRKMMEFYEDVSTNKKGFIINAFNYYWLDIYETFNSEGIYSPAFDVNIQPKIHAANGENVTISPNYLNVNPIIASNNIPIQDQIIYDDYILNILVPEKLRPYENYILIEYLHYFYFHKVEVENIYNIELNYPINTTPIEDLSVHIIYVEDGQEYFTFNSRIRPKDRNMVKDPIAIIYTGNVDTSFVAANITTSFFFYTEAADPYADILPLIIEHDILPNIRTVDSAFDQNGMVIAEIQQQYIRSVSFAIIMFIANLTVTYNLIANYFEKNGYKLFIKSIFGYTNIKRNIYFIGILLMYSLLAVSVTGLFLGTHIFFIGLVVLVIDLWVAWLIERRLRYKSFSKIIKGEH